MNEPTDRSPGEADRDVDSLLRDRFERQLRSGETPSIEEVLSRSSGDRLSQLLADLVSLEVRVLARRRQLRTVKPEHRP